MKRNEVDKIANQGPHEVQSSPVISENGRDKISTVDDRSKSVDILSGAQGNVGNDNGVRFELFREKSYADLLEKEKIKKDKDIERKRKPHEGRLVDGELKFDDEDIAEIAGVPQNVPDKNLKAGNVLPASYGFFPNRLLGKPIEELDPNIRDKTFVVIAKRFNKKYIYRFSATKAFFLLSPWNPIRRIPVYIATNQFFDYLVITTIIVNIILLAFPDISNIPEYIFLGIYSMEMIIKLLARGFFINKYTYIRDTWNWIDFAVVITSYLTIILEQSAGSAGVNLTTLRTFRLLRVLKTVSIVPGLKTIVNALLRAFRMLLEVILLTLFVLMVFALFALQVYMGALRQKCVVDVSQAGYTPADGDYHEFYSDWVKNMSNWLVDVDGDYVLCGNTSGAGVCGGNYVCLPDMGANPNFGFTGFDHFGWSMLTCFQLITLDFWEDVYNKVLFTSGPWNVLFFMMVVFFGSFYLINLMLAVVAMSYEEEAVSAGKDREREKAREVLARRKQSAIYNIAVLKTTTKKLKWNAKKGQESKEEGKKQIVQVLPAVEITEKATEPTVPNVNEPELEKSKLTISSTPNCSKTSPSTSRNPQKPLVKKQSKDSGFSNRSQVSSQSDGSKKEVKRRDSRERLGNPLDAEEKSVDSANSQKGNANDGFEKENTIDEDAVSCRNEDYVIITAEDESMDNGSRNELIDRNWYCCQLFCRCFVPYLRLQNKIYVVVSDPLFDLFITFCIVLNTVFMATEHHGQPDYWTEVLKSSNYVFTVVFTLEAILKIIALGRFYFKSGWNIFDLLIVIASVIDLGLENIDGLSVFRTFRLLRVFKLAQSWPTLRLLLTIIISTLGALGNLTIVLLLTIYIFAILGMQLFMDKYTVDKFDSGSIPRWNFSDITHSLMLIFRVLCGEWVEPMWDCMRAVDETCMLVFIPTLVFGNFMVLNLFLAMLLNAFASDVLRKSKDENEVSGFKVVLLRIWSICCCCKRKRTSSVGPSDTPLGASSEVGDNTTDGALTSDGKDSIEMTVKRGSLMPGTVEDKTLQFNGILNKHSSKQASLTPTDRSQYTDFGSSYSKDNDKTKIIDDDHDSDIKLGDTAATMQKDQSSEIVVVEECFPTFLTKRCCKCLCWYKFDESSFGRKWHTLRKIACVIVDHKVYEGIVLFVIAASSITLAFEDAYLSEKPTLELALNYLNIIFAIIFTIEMLMKWIAYGFKKYFSAFWTILDFAIVVISLTSVIAKAAGIDQQIMAFRSLRTLRAFRPLRAISRWQGMKIVVNALMLAIPSIFNVLLVCLVFWLIFSIMGVQFFAGKFYKCVDLVSGVQFLPSVIPDKATCLNTTNALWRNSKIHFDDVFNGYLALFQVILVQKIGQDPTGNQTLFRSCVITVIKEATFEGWIEVMKDAVDVTGVDLQPKREASMLSYLYFVLFIIFGSFFTLNLFIGVIIDNFNVLKKKYEGGFLDAFLTPGQRNYYNTIKKLGNKKPQKTIKRPKNKWQAFFFDISMSSKFELAVVAIIFLNMIVMGIEHYQQTKVFTDALDIMNILFTVVFTFEAILKLIGLRWHYFRQPWNVFDFIVVLLSLMGIILHDVLSGVFITPTLLRVVRVFRIGRVLRLIRAAKGIRKLLFALIISLPALFNIGALLFLIMYIYAIIGMSSFMNVKLVGFFNEIVNFRTFLHSFTLLFRLATSAGWNDILDALLIQPPDCDPDVDCGTPWLAIFFMVSYIMFLFLIVINMYIAVILENFSQAHEQEEVGVTDDDFDMFYVVWERFDPLATQFIKYDQLSDFVDDLEVPLGIDKPNEIALVSFNLPIVEGDKLHCLDILMALVKKVLGNVEETEELGQVQRQMEVKFQETFPTRVKTIVKSSTMQRKKEDVAAKTLQRAWRHYKAQKQLRAITGMAMLNVNQSSHSRSNSVISLGRRLSNALSSFFNTSRPGSAVSRLSQRSTTGGTSPIAKRTKNSLIMP